MKEEEWRAVERAVSTQTTNHSTLFESYDMTSQRNCTLSSYLKQITENTHKIFQIIKQFY